jgi:flagellar P-ring protein precursor FlgI
MWAALLNGVLLCAHNACAVEIQDIVRIKGLEQNELVGLGLVTGLNGTGDSTKRSRAPLRALVEVYRRHGFMVESLDELSSTDSVAIVILSVEVPGTGAREGDRLDVHVSTVGDSTDLKGGTLVWTIMRLGPYPEAFAKASGELRVNADDPRKATIYGGAQMLRDVRPQLVDERGTVTLVLNDEYAGFPVADAIASRITQEFALDQTTLGEVWASVDDPKNITLHFAPSLATQPATLLAQIQTIDIDASLIQIPARVKINRDAGVFAITGDVEISPFVLSTRGLTITRISPEPIPSELDPVFSTDHHVAIAGNRETTSASRARLQDLLDALEAMDVPFEDRVSILFEMKEIGVLHAQLISN